MRYDILKLVKFRVDKCPPPPPPPFDNRPKLDGRFVLSSAFVLEHLTARKRDKNNLVLQFMLAAP